MIVNMAIKNSTLIEQWQYFYTKYMIKESKKFENARGKERGGGGIFPQLSMAYNNEFYVKV